MDYSSDYLTRVNDALLNWMRTDNQRLKDAIEKTVEEELFSFEDIKHQIRCLKKTVTGQSIARWAESQNLSPGELNGLSVLALHAGNLPLVGFQDLLAIVLTGAEYRGKISRRDPYILPTLIHAFKEHGLLENAIWSTKLDDLKGFEAEAVIFSGSTSSVENAFRRMYDLHIAGNQSKKLIRTAHYSIAYIPDEHPEVMGDLTEAVFRYGGRGCRSVALVVSPLNLESVKCHFTDYVEAFWMKNPQHQKPPPALFHRFAYNRAVGHSQMWLDDFLIEETEMIPDTNFVLHWVPGDKTTLKNVIQAYGEGLQSVYTADSHESLEGIGREPEPLSTAQMPPVDWKPDGIDTIAWLKRIQ